MTKTRSDVVRMAHRRIGVLAADDMPTADMESFGSETLAGLLAELTASQGLTYDWNTGADNDAIPDSLYLPLSYLLGVDIAAHYEIAPRDSRAAMIGRLRVQEFPDDREDSRDLDDDGTVDEAEAAAAQRAAFY